MFHSRRDNVARLINPRGCGVCKKFVEHDDAIHTHLECVQRLKKERHALRELLWEGLECPMCEEERQEFWSRVSRYLVSG
jgi:hypothetical protein